MTDKTLQEIQAIAQTRGRLVITKQIDDLRRLRQQVYRLLAHAPADRARVDRVFEDELGRLRAKLTG